MCVLKFRPHVGKKGFFPCLSLSGGSFLFPGFCRYVEKKRIFIPFVVVGRRMRRTRTKRREARNVTEHPSDWTGRAEPVRTAASTKKCLQHFFLPGTYASLFLAH